MVGLDAWLQCDSWTKNDGGGAEYLKGASKWIECVFYPLQRLGRFGNFTWSGRRCDVM